MKIASAARPPFAKNGFLVSCERTLDGVLIDPGDEVEDLLQAAARDRVNITMILLTHAHLDHVTGVGRAKAACGAPIWLHPDDLFLYDGVVEQGRKFGFPADPQPPVDRFFEPPQSLVFGDYTVDVRHTPGHCPGGVCLAIGRTGEAATNLFVGDTLFAGSIGRTDMARGDYDLLLHSIRDVVLRYPDSAVVHSGHGPDTTVGIERQSNPFLQ